MQTYYFLSLGFRERGLCPAVHASPRPPHPEGRALPAGPPGRPLLGLPILQGPLQISVHRWIPEQAAPEQRVEQRQQRRGVAGGQQRRGGLRGRERRHGRGQRGRRLQGLERGDAHEQEDATHAQRGRESAEKGRRKKANTIKSRFPVS